MVFFGCTPVTKFSLTKRDIVTSLADTIIRGEKLRYNPKKICSLFTKAVKTPSLWRSRSVSSSMYPSPSKRCRHLRAKVWRGIPTTAKHGGSLWRQTLGRHKVPVHIFWLEAGEAFPQTGTGKIKKHIRPERGARHVLSLNAGFH
jgi:hypothetical protein